MKILRLLLFTLSFATTLVVNAYDFEANGLYFNFVSTGDLTCALAKGPSDYTGALVIPDEVEYSGKKLKVVSIACKLSEVSSIKFNKYITEIDNNCFEDNQIIVNVTLPSSITKIGYNAFKGCTSLTSVKWEGDMVLSEAIFRGCNQLKNLSYRSISKTIPREAFYNCSSLLFKNLSEVNTVGDRSFYGCEALSKIDLSSIQEIGDNAFYNCGNISLLIIGSNISAITQNAWKKCVIDSLAILPSTTSLYLNDPKSGHRLVGNKATYYDPFFNETSINGLYLGRETGPKTTNLEVYFPPFAQKDLKSVRIGSLVSLLRHGGTSSSNSRNIKWVGYFEGCQDLNNVVFEGNDISIGDRCFQGTNIKEINLPKGKNILAGGSVFPTGITSITFGYQVSSSSRLFYETQDFIKQISFLSLDPPSFTFNPEFSNRVYTSAKLLVPYGSKKAYQNSDPWKNFWNIEEMPSVNTEKVEIKAVNTNLYTGDSIKLTGIRHPEYATDTLQWKSSNIKIATISNNGLVTAVAPGKTTITVISGKASATCDINVSPVAAEKIVLSHEKVSLNESDTIKITATIIPETTTDKTIKWASSDEKIATVSKDGVIKALKVGTAKITAACGDISAICKVTVLPIAAEKIVLNHDKVAINESDTIKITATISPETTTDKTIKWASSDEKIATVSKDGVIKALKAGTAKITATCGDVSATCEVTILPINAEKIVLSHDKVSINKSDTLKITATVTPETTTDKTIKWTSSDEKIATVSKDGLVTATGAGTATITATCGEISTSCEVTVYEPNIEVEFSDNTLSITVECSESSTNVSIFTVFGQCIYRQTIKAAVVTTEEIDLAELPSGTYVVHVISDIIKISKRIVKTETK